MVASGDPLRRVRDGGRDGRLPRLRLRRACERADAVHPERAGERRRSAHGAAVRAAQPDAAACDARRVRGPARARSRRRASSCCAGSTHSEFSDELAAGLPLRPARLELPDARVVRRAAARSRDRTPGPAAAARRALRRQRRRLVDRHRRCTTRRAAMPRTRSPASGLPTRCRSTTPQTSSTAARSVATCGCVRAPPRHRRPACRSRRVIMLHLPRLTRDRHRRRPPRARAAPHGQARPARAAPPSGRSAFAAVTRAGGQSASSGATGLRAVTEESDRAHRRRRLSGRDRTTHRAATPLELLFDLTFVVAFGHRRQRARPLPRRGSRRARRRSASPSRRSPSAWAWINYSWFASAYDTDDWVCRVATMVADGRRHHPRARSARDVRVDRPRRRRSTTA